MPAEILPMVIVAIYILLRTRHRAVYLFTVFASYIWIIIGMLDDSRQTRALLILALLILTTIPMYSFILPAIQQRFPPRKPVTRKEIYALTIVVVVSQLLSVIYGLFRDGIIKQIN